MKIMKLMTPILVGGGIGFVVAHKMPLSKEKQAMKCDNRGYRIVQTVADACAAFPQTSKEVQQRAEIAEKHAKEGIARLAALQPNSYSKETVLVAFDVLKSVLASEIAILSLIKSVHPNATMLAEAEKQFIHLSKFAIEHIEGNKALYQLFKAYEQGAAQVESLSADDRYFLQQVIEGFELQGLHLSDQQQQKVVVLKKRCAELESEFHRLIDQDTTTIKVAKEGLAGIPEDFCQTLEQEGDLFVLPMNYPTQAMVMNYCSVEQTRKEYSKAFKSRSYPANEPILQELIAKRHEYAQLLGFESYAAYDLAKQMIKTPERAWNFENDLQKRTLSATEKDFKQLTSDLPAGIRLTADGKINPWDYGFVHTHFKKKHYSIDEREWAEYFPMEKTVAGLIQLYEEFFNITIETVPVTDMWHPDVRLLQVVSKTTSELLGYVFLDMFPRDKKYGHAAAFEGVVALKKDDGTRTAATVTVVCNFTKPTAEKPSLLRYDEVTTFFHEFGHALHVLFGATTYASLAGFNTEVDFVELPSQMLENWMKDPAILKQISSHYLTGKPLSDDLIEKRIELLKFGQGLFVASQLVYGMVSLTFFGPLLTESLADIYQRISQENNKWLAYDAETHGYCSFGHLTGYGAKYYGYMWALVLAEDVFEQIKKEGLLNPQAGKKYVDAILSKGGSCDANDMLRNYLGREPQFDAFYKKMGF